MASNTARIVVIGGISLFAGCATVPIESPSPPPTVYDVKIQRGVPPESVARLQANGYAPGVWKPDCSQAAPSEELSVENGAYLFKAHHADFGFTGEVYDVIPVKDQVITVKLRGYRSGTGGESLVALTSGFIKGKRLTFKRSSLPLNGPGSGVEVIEIKDGYSVDANGMQLQAQKPLILCN